jgi:hypothetical protein
MCSSAGSYTQGTVIGSGVGRTPGSRADADAVSGQGECPGEPLGLVWSVGVGLGLGPGLRVGAGDDMGLPSRVRAAGLATTLRAVPPGATAEPAPTSGPRIRGVSLGWT